MSISNSITILGAGVSGITTAVVLELLGYNTQIIAKDRADRPQNTNDPAFASLYPSASVIPHSVFGDQVLSYFADAQRIFTLLMEYQMKGLSVNQHFEVFEYKKEIPRYASAMNNFRPITQPWQSVDHIPHHPHTDKLYGWSFDCFFADWPIYLPQLFEWFERQGGTIIIKKIQPADIRQLNTPIVNCTSLAGRHLFGNATTEHTVWKGHLVHVKHAPAIRNELGQSISYNYNPTPQTYADAEGNPQDVYCYPRQDGWIIGGSRLAGRMLANGSWTGIETGARSTAINGVTVPTPIIELNSQILNCAFNVDLDACPDREAVVGYRYIRNTADGLRLEKVEPLGRPVIHNYGHGGAGVALSWGCAVQVANLLAGDFPAPTRTTNLSPILQALQTELYTMLEEKL